MCVFIYVCVYICVYVCMYVCVCVLGLGNIMIYHHYRDKSITIVIKARDDNNIKAIFNLVIYRVHDILS